MKEKILKNLKELIIMLVIYFSITIILSLVFKSAAFTSMSLVYVIMVILSKLIYTIYDCSKKR
jgi:c-di-AMP phosphodiesterase-like protein